MEVKLKTKTLQSMVSKSIKCVSNNKLIPLTSLLSIKVSNNLLTLTTTDATNYFYITSEDKVDCEDFEVSVLADLFTKLIQKTTSEYITLIIDGNILKVKGNGTYTIELPLDENGNPIKFPVKIKETNLDMITTIKASSVQNILAVNKSALADNMEFPILTCYYCSDSVTTSNRKIVCRNSLNMFEKPVAITPMLMELLGVMSEEEITVLQQDESYIYRTKFETVYTPITTGIESFPAKGIDNIIEQDFKSTCKVSKNELLNVLDRLALFVASYDKKQIFLTFTDNGILISSSKSTGEELIPYVESKDFEPYTCCLNIEMLSKLVSTQTSDNIELSYGSDTAIKLSNERVVQILALMQDDRTEE